MESPAPASRNSGAVIGLILLLLGVAVTLRWMTAALSSATTGAGRANPQLNDSVRTIEQTDHVRGNTNAPVVIIEYADLECPYCKEFHSTLTNFVTDPGVVGRVAWVFRHLPVEELHSRAQLEAEAAECAGEIGGEPAFWAFVDRVYTITPSNNGLDPAQLPVIATQVGVDATAFTACVDSGRHRVRVETDTREARSAGAQGTPFTVIFGPNNRSTSLNGAISESELRLLISGLLE